MNVCCEHVHATEAPLATVRPKRLMLLSSSFEVPGSLICFLELHNTLLESPEKLGGTSMPQPPLCPSPPEPVRSPGCSQYLCRMKGVAPAVEQAVGAARCC